ncbi:MAG: O-phospho-L-seryl-tRNA:Cys-tRNA synthase [Candidatus Bathyarchaeia archaeon]
MRNRYKDHIIVHPIMTGGIVSRDVQEKLFEEGWMKAGYAVCFDCIEGRSSFITKPPVRSFLGDVADFFGGDVSEHTFGCRAAQFAVFNSISEYVKREGSRDYTNVVLTDPLCHYTTATAAEMTGLRLVEAPHSGYPEYKVRAESFAERIEEVKRETGKLPGLVALTHAEPYYGNVNPVEEAGKISKEYDVPYMVNAAYTAGIMPVNMRRFQADFLTVSAHKSMASMGPLGFLVTNYEWAKSAFKNSTMVTDWSGRAFGKKLPNIFGCSVGGAPLISAMCSFPTVVQRVERWGDELDRTRWFIDEMEKLGDVMLIGERPHRHHLLHFEMPLFWEISQHHKRRGFYLAEEMIKRGIVGLHRGMSKHIKLSLYGLTWEEVKRVRDAFREIASKYASEFNLDFKIP